MGLQLVQFKDLGNMQYQQAWDLQEDLLQKNIELKKQAREQNIDAENTVHYFFYVEHPHVITLGKSGVIDNLLLNNEQLTQKGVTFIKTNRGGDITYHGPGQIVGYPILDLEKLKPDLVWYMRSLEEVIIRTLAEYNIEATRLEGSTGVWLDIADPFKVRKICAMGVRTSRWVTMHGFALNVNTDLNFFNYIVPCGISDKAVTSMQKELGKEINIEDVKNVLLQKFEEVFEIEIK